jgi:hypothetical protein
MQPENVRKLCRRRISISIASQNGENLAKAKLMAAAQLSQPESGLLKIISSSLKWPAKANGG